MRDQRHVGRPAPWWPIDANWMLRLATMPIPERIDVLQMAASRLAIEIPDSAAHFEGAARILEEMRVDRETTQTATSVLRGALFRLVSDDFESLDSPFGQAVLGLLEALDREETAPIGEVGPHDDATEDVPNHDKNEPH